MSVKSESQKWVSVVPLQVQFGRPLSRGQQATLRCLNFSQRTVAVKLKTTSPDLFYCRPVTQFIQNGQENEIEIRLTSLVEKTDKSAWSSGGHRFVLLARPVESNNRLGPDDYWTQPKSVLAKGLQLIYLDVLFAAEPYNPRGAEKRDACSQVKIENGKTACDQRLRDVQVWVERLKRESDEIERVQEKFILVERTSTEPLEDRPTSMLEISKSVERKLAENHLEEAKKKYNTEPTPSKPTKKSRYFESELEEWSSDERSVQEMIVRPTVIVKHGQPTHYAKPKSQVEQAKKALILHHNRYSDRLV